MASANISQCPLCRLGCAAHSVSNASLSPISDIVAMAWVDALLPSGDDHRVVDAEALLCDLDDDDLRLAWHSSCRRLARLRQRPKRITAMAALVLERAWYLDEMERREPDGSRAWGQGG